MPPLVLLLELLHFLVKELLSLLIAKHQFGLKVNSSHLIGVDSNKLAAYIPARIIRKLFLIMILSSAISFYVSTICDPCDLRIDLHELLNDLLRAFVCIDVPHVPGSRATGAVDDV